MRCVNALSIEGKRTSGKETARGSFKIIKKSRWMLGSDITTHRRITFSFAGRRLLGLRSPLKIRKIYAFVKKILEN